MNKQIAGKVIVKSGPSKAYKALMPWNKDKLIRRALALDAAHKLTIHERDKANSTLNQAQSQIESLQYDNQQLGDELSRVNEKLIDQNALIGRSKDTVIELLIKLNHIQDKYIQVIEEPDFSFKDRE